VELTVDATGAVAQARVVEGLGHGLDEAAIEAARTYRFEPATRCGKAVSATFTIAIRFTI
jgi:protein TonB